MLKRTKIWLIVALCLVFAGTGLFLIGMAKNGWSFRSLGTKNFVTNSYEIEEEFDGVFLDANTADVNFKYSTDGKCRVVCFENVKEKHSATVENGVLNIKAVNEKKWYDYITLFSSEPKITVYLPTAEGMNLNIKVSTGDVRIDQDFTFDNIDISGSTGDVECNASSVKQTKIHLSTGDIRVDGVSAGSSDLSVTTGKIALRNIQCAGEVKVKVKTGDSDFTNVDCASFVSTGTTGDIELNSVIVSGTILITRSTGDVEFERCDAGELNIKVSTGDVDGTLLSSKVFIVKTDTGEIEVPRTTTGGICEITTTTGDIEIRVLD